MGLGFGWVPLAPFETYHPWYGHSGNRYHEMANVNIMSNYRNARVGNGVSGMNSRDFGRGTPVRAVPVAARELANASVYHDGLPVNPSRESLRMSDRQISGSLAARAAQSGNGRFIASRPAPASNRTPFASRAGGIQAPGAIFVPGGRWFAAMRSIVLGPARRTPSRMPLFKNICVNRA